MITTLSQIEALRFGRHPAFLFGTALGIVLTVLALNEQASDQVTGDSLSMPVVAFTVGLASMITGYHLTRSFQRADEVVEAAPVSLTTRTGALCLAALVPALVASGWLVFYYWLRPATLRPPEWLYGEFSHADVAMVLVGNSVLAAVGGTLLGIAAGRWWRFRGAAVVLVVGVVMWTIGVLGTFSSSESAPAPWQRWVRPFEPVGYFSSATQDNTSIISLTGSPSWHLAWLVTLCALAVVAALLWRAEGPSRQRLILVGVVTVVVSAVTYGLAAGGGLSEPMRTYPDGHSVVLIK